MAVANTYSACFVHIVFSVKRREAMIHKSWSNELEKYLTTVIQNQGHKLLAIKTMPDHIHILIGYNMNQLIPKLVEMIKTSSNHWIRRNGFSKFKFDWQKGYGAFTYCERHYKEIINYINNQEEHHRKKSFKKEYKEQLDSYEIPYDDKYLFDFFDDDEE